MICPKCGNEYDDSNRCCFKCGALNPNNSENLKNNITNSILDVQKKEFDKYKKNSFFNLYSFYDKKQDKKRASFLNNFPLFLIINIIAFFIYLVCGSLFKKIDINIGVFSYFICCLISMFCFASLEFIFDKADYTWWSALIPIYNIVILSKIIYSDIKVLFVILIFSFLPKISIFLFDYLNIDILYKTTFLPFIYLISFVILILIYIITMLKFSKRFGANQLLTVLFSFIMIPVIAFNKKYNYNSTGI